MPEERGLYKKMKIGEQTLLPCPAKRYQQKRSYRENKEWFAKFEMEGWWNKSRGPFSGMQQKLQFVTTVLHTTLN